MDKEQEQRAKQREKYEIQTIDHDALKARALEYFHGLETRDGALKRKDELISYLETHLETVQEGARASEAENQAWKRGFMEGVRMALEMREE